MIIVLKGMLETEELGITKVHPLGKIMDGRLCQIVTTAPVIFHDVTEQGVFLTAAQVAEIVKYGMSDSPSSRMLVEFHKKQPIIEEKS